MAQSPWRRAVIIVAGVLINFLAGWIIFSGVLFFGSASQLVIADVSSTGPAAEAGVMAGDIIKGFNNPESFIGFIDSRRGNDISLVVHREIDGRVSEEHFSIVPRVDPPAGEGALGIAFTHTGIPRVPWPLNITEGFNLSVRAAGAIFVVLGDFFSQLFSGNIVADMFVGPVGVVAVAGETADLGFIYFVQLLGLISVNLAVLNILPIPALDGGRLLFIVIEKLRGRPMNFRRESFAHALGFLVLIFLMILLTVRDVSNLL